MDRRLPDQVTMGLLQYLTTHALDEDYATAAERRGARDGTPRRSAGLMAAVALAVFGVLAAMAALQTAPGTDESRERQDLVKQVTERRDNLEQERKEVLALQKENERLEARLIGGGGEGAAVFRRRQLLAERNGNLAVHGPGVRITVDDAANAGQDRRRRVLDTDLQHLANGLWEAGAEAVAINGERLTNLSAIRHAGDAITVNFRPLDRPYRVEAIGDPDRLPARFGETTSGQTWLDLQREIGLRFQMRVVDELALPAAPSRPLRYAERLGGKDEEKVS